MKKRDKTNKGRQFLRLMTLVMVSLVCLPGRSAVVNDVFEDGYFEYIITNIGNRKTVAIFGIIQPKEEPDNPNCTCCSGCKGCDDCKLPPKPEDFILNIPETVEYENETYTVTEISICRCVPEKFHTIIIPNSVVSLGYNALASNYYIETVIIPASVKEIGYFCFEGDDNLVNFIIDEDNPYFSSQDGMLMNKDKTVLYSWPSATGTVKVPDGITTLARGAFYYHDRIRLKIVYLPSTVTEIGDNAFGENELDCLWCYSEVPPVLGSYVFYYGIYETDFPPKTIYVPQASVELYKSADGWKKYADRIKPFDPANIDTILESSESESQDFPCVAPGKSVNINDVFEEGFFQFIITSVNDRTLLLNKISELKEEPDNPNCTCCSGCKGCDDCKLPPTPEDFILYIPKTVEHENETYTVTAIGKKCCIVSLPGERHTVIIPNSIIRMEEEGLAYNYDIETVIIPASVEYIGPRCFGGDINLLNLIIDEDNPYFSSQDGMLMDKDKTILYSWPSARGTVKVPDGITTLARGAFYRHDEINLKIVYLPSTVTEIGDYAFEQTHLDYLLCFSEIPPVFGFSIFMDTGYGRDFPPKAIYVPQASIELYKSAEGWKKYSSRIQPFDPANIDTILESSESEAQDFTVYGLDGRLVMRTSDYNEVKGLDTGIYVINGEKIYIGR